jgi:uncharacterized protein (DUF488 family)
MPILTVGYGLREADEMVALLQRYGVEYVGDVRSVPHSRRRSEFSREPLERLLRSAGLRYVSLSERRLADGRTTRPATTTMPTSTTTAAGPRRRSSVELSG